MKENLRLHPFLIAIYPVLYLYSENIRQLSVSVVLLPIVVSSALVLLFLLVGKQWLGNVDRSAMCVSVFFVWLFSYSAVRSIIVFEIAGMQLYRHRYFILIWILVLIVFLALAVKVRLNYAKITRALNVFAMLLVLLPLWTLVTYRSNERVSPRLSTAPANQGMINGLTKIDSLPNIYYIILDAYTGQSGLNRYLDFDNSRFVQFLRSRGFFVAEDSHSNYAWTSLSLASSLNMIYLPVTPHHTGSDTLQVADTVSEYEWIQNSEARDFLQSLGYNYVDLSIWSTRIFVSPKDYTYQYFTSEFNLSLLRMTILNRPLVENYFLGRVKRERTLKTIDDLRKVVDTVGPVFVYAHLLVPHHPYVFDSTGNLPAPHKLIAELGSETAMYLSQLLYANRRMEEIIDVILSKSKTPPIIVLQSDHGAYQLAGNADGNMRLRMSILNAFYLPGENKGKLYDCVTPVNTFRLIFDSYFGTKYGLLEDENFFSKMESYRRLINVTDQLQKQ